MKRIIAALALFALTALSASADDVPVICTGCNREIRDGAATCPHCGTKAPEAEPVPEPVQEVKRDTGKFTETLAIDHAIFADKKTSAPVKLASVRNTLAIIGAHPDAVSADARKKLRETEIATLAKLSLETVPCPGCNGTGIKTEEPLKPIELRNDNKKNIKTIEEAAKIDTAIKHVKRSTCPVCGGNGRRLRARDRKAVLAFVLKGVRDYAVEAETRGSAQVAPGIDVHVAAAEAPAETDEKEIASLCRRLRSNVVCTECAGTATTPCSACDGLGGDCAACSGKGVVPCKKCHGTGEREICRQCNGLGISDKRDGGEYTRCRTCGGTGRAR